MSATEQNTAEPGEPREPREPREAGPGSSAGARLENLLARLRWQVGYYLLHFVEGDHQWGQMRYTAILAVVLIFVVISRLFEPITSLPLLDWIVDYLGLRETIPAPALNLAAVVLSFFTRQVLRHAIPVVLGVLVAVYFGAAYIRELLELPNLQQALKYLTATLFGNGYPRMEINNGKAAVADPETNPMLKIGGTVRFPRERLVHWLHEREQGFGRPRMRKRVLAAAKSRPGDAVPGRRERQMISNSLTARSARG